jgi:hypothetical protein
MEGNGREIGRNGVEKWCGIIGETGELSCYG